MDDTYRKNKRYAIPDGIEFQVSLLTVVLLNAYQKQKDIKWKLSTENQDAGKFDDLILELPHAGALLLQAKFRGTRKVTKQLLLSNNSKNADFSLAKYFFSFQQDKKKFNVETIAICTNADIDFKGLEGMLTPRLVSQDSMLHYEDCDCALFTLNENILSELKAHVEVYCENNLRGKGTDASIITDENLRKFLGHLQLIFKYPSGDRLLELIERLLDGLDCTGLTGKVSSRDVYGKIEEWLKQPKGVYLTEARTRAILCEIKSDKYSETLKSYKVSFQNDFDFTHAKRMYHIVTEGGRLMQALKIYHALRKCNGRKLYINSEDGLEVLEESIKAFELRCYTYLVIVWSKIDDKSSVRRMGEKLKEILQIYPYKKVVLIDEGDSEISGYLELSRDDCDVTDGSVMVEDLSKDAKDRVLRSKSVVFQGRHVSLSKLLPPGDYGAINSEILEKLLQDEEIKVGAPLSGLDEHINRYYVNRTFKRTLEEKQSTERMEINSLDDKQDTQVCQNCFHEILRTQKEEIVPEDKIYDVSDKLILIADSAGTGKSTILTKLATIIKEHNPSLWVIKIELNDYTEVLQSFLRNGKNIDNVKDLLNSRTATKLTNRLENYVFGTSQKVVLMFDGIDEISPDYTGLILGLLERCKEEPNFSKIFVTTRLYMVKELVTVLEVNPFLLQPFMEQNQIDFLTSYWVHNLQLEDDTSKDKCKSYAKALINNISWTYLQNNNEKHFASIPLHLRMTAEIFQENTRLDETTDWGGCKEYVIGDKAEPKLRERMNVTELYGLFIKKKRDIFIDKANPTGNSMANQALKEQFNECLAYHRILALEVILSKDKFRYFPSYRWSNESKATNLLRIGIVQKVSDSFNFVHRTFADYFVAEVLHMELQQNQTLEFQTFLVDTILFRPQYNTTRIFLDSFLLKVVDSIPSNIFEKYQYINRRSSPKLRELQSKLIHVLAGEGCLGILRLVLKCVDFEIVTDKELNIEDFDFDAETTFSNTLSVLQCLTRQVGLNIKDGKGRTPLHCAVQRDRLEMVKFLVQQGANVNSTSNNGRSVLCYAARYGTLCTLQYIIKLGVDVNIRDRYGRTALQVAAQYNRLDMVKFLVEYGLDFNTVDKYGFTLLHSASGCGHLDTVKYLLELGLDCNTRGFSDITALQVATLYGRLDMVKFFVEYGLNFNDSCCRGSTLLHLASFFGHLETVKYLLRLGVDANIKDNESYTALHSATNNGHLDIVKYLVELGLDFTVTNSSGYTLLHSASANGHLETVKFLLELGVDPNIKENEGFTALHEAAHWGRLDIVKYFVEYGLDFNVTNNSGCTPLDSARAYGKRGTMKFLSKLGADANVKENGRAKALHAAVSWSPLNCLKFLMVSGEDISVINNSIRLLHSARARDHLVIVKFLLDLGVREVSSQVQRIWGNTETSPEAVLLLAIQK